MDGNSKDKLQFDEFLLLFPNLKSMFLFNHVKSNNSDKDLLNVTHLERCIEKKKSEKRLWIKRIIHGKRGTSKSTRAQGLVQHLDLVIVVMDQMKYIHPWDKSNNALIILFNETLMNWIYNQPILLEYVFVFDEYVKTKLPIPNNLKWIIVTQYLNNIPQDYREFLNLQIILT